MVKLVKMAKNGQKGHIYKVQYKSLQMSSSIRCRGGDSMSLTLPSYSKFLPKIASAENGSNIIFKT